MPEPAAPDPGITSTLPPPSANGSARPPPAAQRRRRPTRIASIRIGLIVGVGALILLMIFIIQNTHTVHISFLGAHASLSLAIALLIAAIAGALVMAAAGTARITQLRRTMRRTEQRADPGGQAHLPAITTRRDRPPGPAGQQAKPQP
jgi:lipopolysaccharide assembly protein A